jgi:hypothetical protein
MLRVSALYPQAMNSVKYMKHNEKPSENFTVLCVWPVSGAAGWFKINLNRHEPGCFYNKLTLYHSRTNKLYRVES